MGQQQLILIILGIVIVSVAIALGMTLFSTGHDTATRDMIVNDLTRIASHAQHHYIKPASLGGGSNSFDNFYISDSIRENAVAEYTAEPDGRSLVLTGTSISNNELIVTLTVTFDAQGWIYDWNWEHDGL